MAAASNERHADVHEIVGSAAGTLSGAVLGGLWVLVNEALAARLLGLEVYGLFALAVAIAKICEKISIFGLHLAVLHFVPIFRSTGDRARLKGIIIGAMAGCGVSAALAAILVWLSAPALAVGAFGKPAAEPFIRLAACAIPFMSLTELVGNMSRGFGYTRYYVVARNITPQALFSVLIGVLWLYDLRGEWIVLALAISYAGAFAVGVLGLRRSGTRGLMSETASFANGVLLRYAVPIVMNTVLYMVVGWADLLIMGVYRSAGEVGIYRACMQVVSIFDMVTVAINAATARSYALGSHRDEQKTVAAAYALATRWLSTLAVLALIVAITNADDLLGFMGPGFSRGWLVLGLLAVGAAGHCYFGAAGFLLVVTGRQAYEAANAAVAGVLNLALNLMLVPAHGMLGAAISTTSSLILLGALRAAEVRSLFGVRSLRPEILRTLGVGVLVGVTVFAATASLDVPGATSPVALAVRIPVTFGLFILLYWRFCLDDADRQMLRRQPWLTRLSSQSRTRGNSPARPNFFVVGAPKSGTTAMAYFLSQHPDVFMLYRKEAHFFGSDLEKVPHSFFVLDRDRYLSLFREADGAPRQGEASVMYLMSRNAAREIADFDPQAKVIIMLRNPVDMLPSYHSQLLWGAYEDIPDLEQALAAEADRRQGRRIPRCTMMRDALYYREVVRYADQVARYVDALGPDNVQVIVYDDFAADTLGTYRETLRFLGIRTDFVPRLRRVNENKVVRSFRVAQWLQDPPPAMDLLLGLLPDRLRYWFVGKLQRLNTRYVKRVPISARLRAILQAEFEPEVLRLEALIGRPLPAWRSPASTPQTGSNS